MYAGKYELPAQVKLAALGSGTAKAIGKRLFRTPDFIGSSSDPALAIQEFVPFLRPYMKVLIPRAEKSMKRLNEALPAKAIVDWPFYSTYKAAPDKPSQSKYLIFTSPSNAEAYLEKHEISSKQTCVAIGASTASMFVSKGVRNYLVSDTPTEESMWSAILQNKRLI